MLPNKTELSEKDIQDRAKRHEYQKQYRQKNRIEVNKKRRERYQKYREKFHERNRVYYLANREKAKEKAKKYRVENREKVLEEKRLYSKTHREICNRKAKAWCDANREKLHERSRKRRQKNKEYVNATRRKHVQKQYKTNPQFKISLLLRTRIKTSVKMQYANKAFKTIELIGCSINHLRQHLESKFKPGMTWKNHNTHGWHIDHIKPCVSFDLRDPEQQKACFHWSNLQPLWAIENLLKSDNDPTIGEVSGLRNNISLTDERQAKFVA